LAAGVGISIRDYRLWHSREIGTFGQGNVAEVDLAPAVKLGLPYSAFVGKFRLKYPVGWVVKENLVLKKMDPYPTLPKNSLSEIVRFADLQNTAEFSVSAGGLPADLTKFVNNLALGITEERRYINVGSILMTILTWETPQQVVQKNVFVSNGNLFVIEFQTDANSRKVWAKTMDAVYQSWTPI